MNEYTALIRTYNSLPLLNDVLASLKQQTIPPKDILFVDSSNDPVQKSEIKGLGYKVIDYPEESFNFSKAINIGIDQIETNLVLIISSHVVLNDAHLIEKGMALEQFSCDGYLGFCLIPDFTQSVKWEASIVNKHNFGMDNAASNSCAMLATRYARDRPFLEEVFSAEDQEWAAYFLRVRNAFFYKAVTVDVQYLNAHVNNQKTINETVALAYYVHRDMLNVRYIVFRLLRAIIAKVRGKHSRASLHFIIAKELFAARKTKPVQKSKYF